MTSKVTVLRCPRCGSMDAGAVEMIAVLLHRMRCASCQYEQIVDDHSWDERVPEAIVRADHVLPSERFAELWRAFGAQGPWAGTFEQLRDAYGEPHRAYHTAAHLGHLHGLTSDRGADRRSPPQWPQQRQPRR